MFLASSLTKQATAKPNNDSTNCSTSSKANTDAMYWKILSCDWFLSPKDDLLGTNLFWLKSKMISSDELFYVN